MAVTTLRYKHRGKVPYERFYRESKGFWGNVVTPADVVETKYKDKDNEFEGEWEIKHNLDDYHQAAYSIEFKATDLSPTGEPGVYDGKFILTVKADLNLDYKVATIGDKDGKKTFTKPWMKKLYEKLTQGEREEDIYAILIVTSNQYMALVKGIMESGC